MKHLFIGLFFFCSGFYGFSQQKVPVFTAGTEGHKSYRIPAIIGLPVGELLAFCEGRVNSSGDGRSSSVKCSTTGGAAK